VPVGVIFQQVSDAGRTDPRVGVVIIVAQIIREGSPQVHGQAGCRGTCLWVQKDAEKEKDRKCGCEHTPGPLTAMAREHPPQRLASHTERVRRSSWPAAAGGSWAGSQAPGDLSTVETGAEYVARRTFTGRFCEEELLMA